eukprot:EG_transcript_3947
MSESKPSSTNALISAKQQELQELYGQEIQALQHALLQKEEELQQERQNFITLQEDFRYNLKLIEDRDAELERYDATTEELRRLVRERDGAISNLKAAAAAQEATVKELRLRMAEVEAECQRQLQECRITAQRQCQQAERTLREKEAEHTLAWRELQRQARAKEEEWEVQRLAVLRSCEEQCQEQARLNKRREDELERELQELTAKLREERSAGQALALQLEKQKTLYSDLAKQSAEAAALHETTAAALRWELAEAARGRDALAQEARQEAARAATLLEATQEQYELQLHQLRAEVESRSGQLKGLAEQLAAEQQRREQLLQHDTQQQSAVQRTEALWRKEAESLKAVQAQLETTKVELAALQQLQRNAAAESLRKDEEARALQHQVAEMEGRMQPLEEQVGVLQGEVHQLQTLAEEATSLRQLLEEERRVHAQRSEELTRALQVAKREAEVALQRRDSRLAELDAELLAWRRSAAQRLPENVDLQRTSPVEGTGGRPAPLRLGLTDSTDLDFAPIDIPSLSPFFRRLDEVPPPLGDAITADDGLPTQPPPQPGTRPGETQRTVPRPSTSTEGMALVQHEKEALQAAIRDLQAKTLELERSLLEKDRLLLKARQKREREDQSGNEHMNTMLRLSAEVLALKEQLAQSDGDATRKRKTAKLAKYAKSLERENTSLREKLKDAMEDMKRLINERAKLIDISNMLRCDLQRAMGQVGQVGPAAGPAAGSGNPSGSPGAPARAMEENIRKLVEENCFFKAELLKQRAQLGQRGGPPATDSTEQSRA